MPTWISVLSSSWMQTAIILPPLQRKLEFLTRAFAISTLAWDIRNVSADILLKIAKELGVTLEYLLDIPEDEQIVCKTIAEKLAFAYMRALNSFGQRRALQYMQELVLTGIYPPDADDKQDEIFERKLQILGSIDPTDLVYWDTSKVRQSIQTFVFQRVVHSLHNSFCFLRYRIGALSALIFWYPLPYLVVFPHVSTNIHFSAHGFCAFFLFLSILLYRSRSLWCLKGQ